MLASGSAASGLVGSAATACAGRVPSPALPLPLPLPLVVVLLLLAVTLLPLPLALLLELRGGRPSVQFAKMGLGTSVMSVPGW